MTLINTGLQPGAQRCDLEQPLQRLPRTSCEVDTFSKNSLD